MNNQIYISKIFALFFLSTFLIISFSINAQNSHTHFLNIDTSSLELNKKSKQRFISFLNLIQEKKVVLLRSDYVFYESIKREAEKGQNFDDFVFITWSRLENFNQDIMKTLPNNSFHFYYEVTNYLSYLNNRQFLLDNSSVQNELTKVSHKVLFEAFHSSGFILNKEKCMYDYQLEVTPKMNINTSGFKRDLKCKL